MPQEPSNHEAVVASLLTPASVPEEIVGEDVMALASDTDPEVEATPKNPAPSGVTDEIEEDSPLAGETEELAEVEADLEEEADDEGDEADEPELTAAETEYLDISDDDTFEVAIDGKVEYRTVKEAKEALAGEGAIQKRLQEATETRNAINVERDEARLELEGHRTDLVNTISQLSGQLFKPTVPVPDEGLRTSDPALYITQSEAYVAEQTAIIEKQEQLKTYMDDQKRQQHDNMVTYRNQQQAILHEKIPELADPTKVEAAAEQIFNAAKHYGFHPKEIGLAYDHRLFLMARDAGKYRDLIAQQETVTPEDTVKELQKKVTNAPRKLRSGVAARKTQARQRAKEKAKTRDKARNSGKTADIANFILSN